VIPQREDMITFALHLEKIGDERGWDATPALGIALADGDELASTPLPIQPAEIAEGGDVVGALLRIANALMKTGLAARRTRHNQKSADALAGVWFVSEGWMTLKPEEQREGQRISQMADRVEIRQCTLVDCGGRLYTVLRIRGEEPDVAVVDPDQSELRAQGRVPDALRRMLIAFGAGMSDEAIDMEKLGTVGA